MFLFLSCTWMERKREGKDKTTGKLSLFFPTTSSLAPLFVGFDPSVSLLRFWSSLLFDRLWSCILGISVSFPVLLTLFHGTYFDRGDGPRGCGSLRNGVRGLCFVVSLFNGLCAGLVWFSLVCFSLSIVAVGVFGIQIWLCRGRHLLIWLYGLNLCAAWPLA